MAKKSIEDLLNEYGKTTPPKKEPIIINKKNKKRSWKKRFFLFIFFSLVVVGGYFGVKAYSVAKDIFQGSGGVGLLGFLDSSQLKGEAEGRINILLIGVGGEEHSGGNLADTIIVASVKKDTNEVAMLSLPRDLYVEIDQNGKNKINAAHAFGEAGNYPGGGPELLKKTVTNVTGLPIHYFVRVDFQGFEKTINTLGGVDVNVEKELYDPYFPGKTVYFKPGITHMNGQQALDYARSRKTTSDFDRAKRQQQILAEVKDKVFSTGTLLNPKKVSDLMSVLGDHVKTDLKIWEGERLAKMVKDLDGSKIVNRVLDNSPEGLLESDNVDGMYVLLPKSGDYDEIKTLAKNIFNLGGITEEKAKVEVLNGSGVTGKASLMADELEALGIKVENVANNPTLVEKTLIYDRSNGTKPKTLSKIEELTSAKAITGEKGNGYDITVIIGKN